MSKDTAELEREKDGKWCYVQHSNIGHEADNIEFPTFSVSAQVVLPKEYENALIDAGKLRDLLPGLVLNCLTPRPQQGKEGGAK